MPEHKKILLEQRYTNHFPGLLVNNPIGLRDRYQFAIATGKRRIAGHTCCLIVIELLNNECYGYRLYTDVDIGLLLEAQTEQAITA